MLYCNHGLLLSMRFDPLPRLSERVEYSRFSSNHLDGARNHTGYRPGSAAHRRGPLVEAQSPDVDHFHSVQHDPVVCGMAFGPHRFATTKPYYVTCRLLYSFNIRTYCTVSCMALLFHLLDTYRNRIRKKLRSPSHSKSAARSIIGRYISDAFERGTLLYQQCAYLRRRNRTKVIRTNGPNSSFSA
jgi:hypothetical protein